jgi:hypothetical protein
MITNAYRKYIPKKYRDFIYRIILGDILFFIRNFKTIVRAGFSYWFRFIIPRTPTNEAYIFMGKYGICLLPYNFTLKYKKLNIIQYKDESNQLTYVMFNNKKLYFSRNLKSGEIDKMYKQLLAEQDECSAHRYVKDWDELSRNFFLDIGAAEGLISLNVIDRMEHIFLFECDENWIEALNATFAPYKNKITIIKKFISNINDDCNLTIDHFLQGKTIDNLFIKMDIEGAELSALQGAEKTLTDSKNLQLAVCTYHWKNDYKKISDLFSEKGLHYESSDGNVFLHNEFRIGVIRAKSN